MSTNEPPHDAPRLGRGARKRRGRAQAFVALLSGALSLALVFVLAVGAVLYFGKLRFDAPGPLAEPTTVLIESGDGVREIADRLERGGVLEDEWLFTAGVFLNRAEGKLKAGEYAFPPNASMATVLDTIVSGKAVLHQVTIPEGLTSQQIVARLNEHPVLVGEVRDIPREGSLLPETYKFSRGTTREQMIQRMRTAQEKTVAELWEKRDPDLPIRSPEEMVTLASIVEKETGVPNERDRVAAVFVNRLNQKMRLQSDPTIIYGIVGGQGPLGRPIRRSEIDTPTPYNTYQIDGLPPTPIANPGRASLEAVANPSKTDDVYFVADGTGGHAFAKTLEEHNANVKRWREIEKNRAASAAVESAPDTEEPASN